MKHCPQMRHILVKKVESTAPNKHRGLNAGLIEEL